MKMRILQLGALVASLVLFAGCGLTTSSAERIARAQEQIESGEYRAAMIELKNVLISEPENARARTMLAKVSLGLGDVEAAQKELSHAGALGADESVIRPIHLSILSAAGRYTDILASLGLEPGGLSDTQILQFRGDALLGVGNVEAATKSYREWLVLEPDSTDAAVAVASATAAGGDLQTAIASLTEIVTQNPDHVDGWRMLGLVRLQAAMFDEAENALANAVAAFKPQTDMLTYAKILAALTESQLAQGKKADAGRNLDRLKGIAPQSQVTMLLAARLARSEGDYALAARYLHMLLNLDPDNTRAMFFLANVQLMQGNFGQAENLLNRVVVLTPDNIRARKLLVRIQLSQEQPRSAIEALAPLLEDDYRDPDLYKLLAYAKMQQGDPQAAIELFRSAAELAPDDIDIKLNLAAAYIDADDAIQALEVLGNIPAGQDSTYRRERLLISALYAANRRAEANEFAGEFIRDRQSDSGAVLLVADYYVRMARVDEAQQLLQRHLAAGSHEVEVMNALARIELSKQNSALAEMLFLDVRTSDPENLVALLGLARIAELSGDEDGKLRLLETAVAAHDDAVMPRAWLAATHLAASRNNRAEILADELVTIGIRNARVASVVGKVFTEVGRSDDALAFFQVAAQLDQESAKTQLELARAYLSQGRSVDAREALQDALEISPDWLPAVTVLALVELRQGRADDALRIVRRMRILYPENVTAMVLEGEVLAYHQEYEAAAAAFQRAVDSGAGRNAVFKAYQTMKNGNLPRPLLPLLQWLDSNPDDSIVRSVLAQHFQQNSDFSRAVSEYNRVLKDQPGNAAVLNNLAWLSQQTGDMARALELAEEAYSLEAGTGSIADTLGWIYHDLGRQEESVKLLTKASRLSPENSEIRFHLAVALKTSGYMDKSRSLLQDLVIGNKQFPSRAQAEKLLKKLQSEGGDTDA